MYAFCSCFARTGQAKAVGVSLSAALLLNLLWSLPALAGKDDNGAGPQSKPEASGPKYTGTISDNRQGSGQAAEKTEGAGELFLRADICSGKAGLKCQVEPYVTDKCKIKGEALRRLKSSPLVRGRVALWKAWYSRVFEELFPPGYKIPSDLRAKINVTVNKNHKVTASTEWMDPCKNDSSQAYAREFLNKIRSLAAADWIAFPEKSYLEMVGFDLYLLGYDNEAQLANGIQQVDCD